MKYFNFKNKPPTLTDIVMFLGLSMIPAAVFHGAGLSIFWSILLGIGVTAIYAYMTSKKEKKESKTFSNKTPRSKRSWPKNSPTSKSGYFTKNPEFQKGMEEILDAVD